ncbi:hypothetical protein B566_EDAN005076 [Ephemera danica]|nr:hypothetical protein B566_EDAN005076 [Ephemera danica]
MITLAIFSFRPSVLREVIGGFRRMKIRNIVVEWLRSLQLGQYADSFLDNGYDDLEICKQVGDPDLDAIGVFNPNHRQLLLQSVRSLREEGAASVYFTLEETAAATSQHSDNNSTRSSRPSSGRCSDKDVLAAGNSANQANNSSSPAGTTVTLNSNAGAAQVNDSPISSSGSVTELGKYLDEYEEGKAELVRIPKLQLKLLLKDKLLHDGIRLSCQPYSTSINSKGSGLVTSDRRTGNGGRPTARMQSARGTCSVWIPEHQQWLGTTGGTGKVAAHIGRRALG